MIPRSTKGTIRVAVADLRRFMNERAHALVQVTELQEQLTKLVNERRVTLQARVREFFTLADQPMPERPCVPPDDVVRLRIRLVAEEFVELLEAAHGRALPDLHKYLALQLHMPLRVDLPELVDAIADLKYVAVGFDVALGVDGDKVMDVVHAANMAKRGGPKDPVTGKQLKPEGWQPPDIGAELRRQGWKGEA